MAAPGPGKRPHLPANAHGMCKGTNKYVLNGSDQNSHNYCSAVLAWSSTVSTVTQAHVAVAHVR